MACSETAICLVAANIYLVLVKKTIIHTNEVHLWQCIYF